MKTFIKHQSPAGNYKDANDKMFYLIEVKDGVNVASNHPRVSGEDEAAVAAAEGLILVKPLKPEPKPRPEQPARPAKPKVAVEKWIESQGYSAIRLLTVRELEGKLLAAGKVSAKISAIRQWADGLIASFALNPEPRNDWPEAPFAFDEVVQEAVSALA